MVEPPCKGHFQWIYIILVSGRGVASSGRGVVRAGVIEISVLFFAELACMYLLWVSDGDIASPTGVWLVVMLR